MTHCILLIHRTGGSLSCVADTPDAARALAASRSGRHPGSYVACVAPYEVGVAAGHDVAIDTSAPVEARWQWDDWLTGLYKGGAEETR